MATNLGNIAAFPAKATCIDTVISRASIVVGAAGAVAVVVGDMGISAVNAGAGTFTVTFPSMPGTRQSILLQLQSAALTVVDAVITALDTGAGTATVKTLNAAGAATNPASGDIVVIVFIASSSGAAG